MASPAHGSRSGSERLPPAILRLFAPLDEDPRLEGKGLAAAFAAAFPDLPDEKSGWARKPQPLRRLGADGGRVAPTSLTRRGMRKLRLNRQFCYETLGGGRDTQAHT